MGRWQICFAADFGGCNLKFIRLKLKMEIQQNNLFQSIKEIIVKSRQQVYRMVNSSLLQTYWEIGRLIVVEEQNGKGKAQYGKGVLKNLANSLTFEFGRGFDERNLNNMRAFYNAFPIWNAMRTELSWTHYRLYMLYLPKEEELKEIIEQDRLRFELDKE